eukprot:TRINITY_DN78225_c0_g1_i1.p1 TRINITY_DN78225_c0_g1~~TRINITY_DN78225_c0_g1_i1.p1  ORF type:complete len:149 (+),score=17.45 TRINITY_DN78225_c0_g1_i1:51-497(+)
MFGGGLRIVSGAVVIAFMTNAVPAPDTSLCTEDVVAVDFGRKEKNYETTTAYVCAGRVVDNTSNWTYFVVRSPPGEPRASFSDLRRCVKYVDVPEPEWQSESRLWYLCHIDFIGCQALCESRLKGPVFCGPVSGRPCQCPPAFCDGVP